MWKTSQGAHGYARICREDAAISLSCPELASSEQLHTQSSLTPQGRVRGGEVGSRLPVALSRNRPPFPCTQKPDQLGRSGLWGRGGGAVCFFPTQTQTLRGGGGW